MTTSPDQVQPPPAATADPPEPQSASAEPARGLDLSDFTILLSRQRSGTNAFRSALNTHPDLFCFNEVFNLPDRDSEYDFLRKTNFFGFLETYGAGDLRRTLPDRHEEVFLDFLEYLRCFSPKRCLVVDVKCNTAHFLALPWSENTTVPYLFDLIVSHRLRVLHLTRRNYLRNAISVLKAWRSGKYSLLPREERPEDTQLEIDPDWLMDRFETYAAEDTMIARHFGKYPLYRAYDYTEVFPESTEEMAPDLRQELAAWFGIPDSFGRVTQFRKQSSLPLAETILNYDEIAALLANTQYAYCLDDEPLYRSADFPSTIDGERPR